MAIIIMHHVKCDEERGSMTASDAGESGEVGLSEAGFLTSSGYLLARIGAESRRRWRRMLADHDLAEHPFGVLMALDQVGPQSQQGLSRILGIDPRNAVAALHRPGSRPLTHEARAAEVSIAAVRGADGRLGWQSPTSRRPT
jgi:hypothetical protein